MARQLIIFGQKTFRVLIPDEAKVTFGPWSPPTGESKYVDRSEKALSGTLRVYETKKAGASILAVFSGVSGFRDTSLEYEEEVVREEGSIIWKSDEHGYRREEKRGQKSQWGVPQIAEPGELDDDDAT